MAVGSPVMSIHPESNIATVYDLTSIIPFLKKHNVDPCSGLPLTHSDLIKLNFEKNSEDEYICPITFKVFNDHSNIVAIKTTGNVYSFDAVEKLNIKVKNWKDLLNETPFKRSDIITIQDPHNLTNKDISSFHYVKNNIEVKENKEIIFIKSTSGTSDRVLATLKKKEEEESQHKNNVTKSFVSKNDNYNAAPFSTGKTSASFTSTGVSVSTKTDAFLYSEVDYLLQNIPKSKKAFISLKTNLGDLNLELFCGDCPKACYNFIMLSKRGDYNNSTFHRVIKNFMAQAGKTKENKSIYGKDFEDEFKPNLLHDKRGLLCLANHGKNTNSTQFYITFKP
ncbi:Peptidyl-prolyl cis-trans isomerase cyp8, partial [Lobulomyces angularis]